MPKTKIPSPTRSQGDPVTSRRQKPRTRSVSSPARSNASGSSTVREANMNSFVVSPLGKTMLNDDTDIEQPRCPSWFKRLDHSRVVSEVLDTDTGAVDNVLDELDIDVLSHEKKDDTMDLPESSNSSRISSIVIHQRKLFWTKEHLQQKRYREIDKTRESLAKKKKTNITDKIPTGPRNLLNEAPKRTKPIFPGASFKYFPDNTPNKTKILSPEVKARNLFGNRPGTKRKNIYADFILSESEDDISEIQPKFFALKKNLAPVRHSTARPRVSSSNSSVTTDIEMDDWDLLPSSTMVEHQTEATVGTTRRNRTILSKSSEVNESTFANSTANKTKHSNKSASKNHGNDDLNEIAKEKTNVSLKGEPKGQVDVVNEDNEKQNDNIKTLQKISNKSKPVKKYVEEQAVDVQETNDDEEEAEQKQETEVNEQEIEDEQVEEEEMVLQMEDEDENDNNKIEQEVSDNEEQNESQEVQDDNLEEDNSQCNSANNSLNVENDEEDEEIESDNEEEIQNESQNIENDSQDDQEESDDDETESEEKESSDEEQDESRELLNESQEQEIENTSQEQSDEENNADIKNDSAEVEDENDEEIQDDSEGLSDGDQEDNEQYDQEGNEKDDQEDNEQDDQEAEEQETEEFRKTKSETPNVSHDTTGRNRKKNLESPEAVRNEVTNQTISFITKGRNKSITKTENIFKTKHSLAPVTESTRLSDGTKNSSAEGSGWDSHRTTRKTLRQTFGRDFTPRKSLRAMVMEKSAKRQTAINEANAALNLQEAANDIPPEDAQEEKDCDDNVQKNIEESDHEVSKRTRQTALEMRIEKIKKENRERRLRIEEEVRNSFKFDRHRTDFLTRTPPKPNPHTAKPVKIAPKKRSKFSILSSIYYLPPQLLEDLKYKPPKRYQPKNAAWITKRLYKFLETKLEPVYNYKSRVRAEELVKMMYKFAQDTRRLHGVAPHAAVADLEHEMARLHIVRTHFEFYNFIHDYLPLEVKIKVVPDIINDIPLPSNGLFGDIIESE